MPDQSGSVDVFLGLNMQGNSNSISIFDTGTGTNLSPNTTSISNSPAFSYTPSTANYSYRAVNYLTDGGTTNDNTPLTTGDPDYYVSFAVPFADVVSFLNSKSIVINENSGLGSVKIRL